MIPQTRFVQALRNLVDAVVEENDMDAISTKLGKAVNSAEELIDEATKTAKADAYLDQSKW